MSLQICPKCHQKLFTWFIDEEVSPFTIWGCSCGYMAFEDEAFERKCSNCGRNTESKLKDEEKEYWWCASCNRITLISCIVLK